jgi:hypothetical protein
MGPHGNIPDATKVSALSFPPLSAHKLPEWLFVEAGGVVGVVVDCASVSNTADSEKIATGSDDEY